MKLSSVSGIITQKQPEVKCTWFTTYDLVSRGADVENKNQCWGFWESSANSYGPGYQYACIHSGSHSGENTTWYNYVLATAGTIYSEDTGPDHSADNTTLTTESICPKGWTLPNRTQTRSIGPDSGSTTYVSAFSPIITGAYMNGTLGSEDTEGNWWSSQSSSATSRARLVYKNDALNTGGLRRYDGIAIRCVQAS